MFLSNLWNSAKNLVSSVWDRGSTLLTGSHYIGPGNSTSEEYRRKNPPVSASDRAAMEHDLEYERIAHDRDAGRITTEEARRQIRASDRKVMEGFWNGFTEHPWGSLAGMAGIGGKMYLEDHHGLDPNIFVRP